MQPFHPLSPRPRDLPATPDSPALEKEHHFGSEVAVRREIGESHTVLREYEEHRDGWVFLINEKLLSPQHSSLMTIPRSDSGKPLKSPSISSLDLGTSMARRGLSSIPSLDRSRARQVRSISIILLVINADTPQRLDQAAVVGPSRSSVNLVKRRL